MSNADISILIVDDNDMTRETLRVVLRHDGYNVVGEAVDGGVAMEMVRKFKPHMILLDVVMPKVSGLEALRAIKMISPDVAILMVTATKDQATVTEAVQAGISGYIIKPFNAKKVLDTVEAVANKIRASRPSSQPSIIAPDVKKDEE
jgi:two-component system, chemotaxis family, chemotaxis protein CheY